MVRISVIVEPCHLVAIEVKLIIIYSITVGNDENEILMVFLHIRIGFAGQTHLSLCKPIATNESL